MDINQLWATVEPFITAIAGTAAGGVIVGFICRLFQNRLLRKLDSNAIAKQVTEKIGNTAFNVDLTVVTEKKLAKIENALHKQIEQIQEQTAAYKHLLAQIGGAVAHFKSLTDEERETLQAAVKTLDEQYVPPEPEQIVTVKLEPITPAREAEPQEEEHLINFGGMAQ